MNSIQKTLKTAGFMIIATLGAKLLGMYRDVLLASFFGTGQEAQAFLTASRIPLLFFDITLGTAVSAAFIPVFNGYLQGEKKEKATEYANIFITFVFVITTILCVFGMLASGTIVNFIGNDLSFSTKALASKLVVIMFPSMIFTALAYSLSGLLQSYGEFNAPAAISLFSNGFMVLFMLLFKNRLTIELVSVFMLISWSLQFLILLPALIKKKFKYHPKLSFKNEGIKKTVALALPILLSSWVQPINTTVNIYLASSLNEGRAVAALDYANKLYIIFVGVITYAISNLMFPSLSRAAQNEDKSDFNKISTTALSTTCAVLLPVMALFMLLDAPIVSFVYERGAFDAQSTYLTSSALLFYSIGMLGFGVQEIMNKVFYSLSDAKTPMTIALLGISLNVLLSFFFIRGILSGIWGLSLSASIASCFIGFSLMFLANKRAGFLDHAFFINLLKQVISTLVMAALVYIYLKSVSFTKTTIGNLLTLLTSGALGVFVYMILLAIFKTKETSALFGALEKIKK